MTNQTLDAWNILSFQAIDKPTKRDGFNPLHTSVAMGSLSIVKFIVEMIQIRDKLPSYAEETESFVRFNFIEIKECESTEKMTPLLLATKFDHYEVFEYLISLGCNPFVSCTQLMNPLHYAIEN